MTTTYLQLYILNKVEQLQKQSSVLQLVGDIGEAHECMGKLELLKEMWEDLHLGKKDKEETITYHNQI
jgi:hypothetical protein